MPHGNHTKIVTFLVLCVIWIIAPRLFVYESHRETVQISFENEILVLQQESNDERTLKEPTRILTGENAIIYAPINFTRPARASFAYVFYATDARYLCMALVAIEQIRSFTNTSHSKEDFVILISLSNRGDGFRTIKVSEKKVMICLTFLFSRYSIDFLR